MAISFQKNIQKMFDRDCVRFEADVDGKTIHCFISYEALQDNYNGNGVEPTECFELNRQDIQDEAERLIQQNRFEQDGTIFIRS